MSISNSKDEDATQPLDQLSPPKIVVDQKPSCINDPVDPKVFNDVVKRLTSMKVSSKKPHPSLHVTIKKDHKNLFAPKSIRSVVKKRVRFNDVVEVRHIAHEPKEPLTTIQEGSEDEMH